MTGETRWKSELCEHRYSSSHPLLVSPQVSHSLLPQSISVAPGNALAALGGRLSWRQCSWRARQAKQSHLGLPSCSSGTWHTEVRSKRCFARCPTPGMAGPEFESKQAQVTCKERAAETQMVDFHCWSFTSNQLHIQYRGSRFVPEEELKFINDTEELWQVL